jgi:hypothetical protein
MSKYDWKTLSKSWVRLPVAVLQILTPTQAVLIAYLIDRCQDSETTYSPLMPDYHYTTRQRLSKATGIKLRTLDRTLADLRALELIDYSNDGRGLSIFLTGASHLLPPRKGGHYNAKT